MIIKLNDRVDKQTIRIKGCKDCVFCRYNAIADFGELTGDVDMYCVFLSEEDGGTILENAPGYQISEIEDDFILKNCPIIDIYEED